MWTTTGASFPCGFQDQSEPATASSRDFATTCALQCHPHRHLDAEIATNYGIARSANRALVSISMVRKEAGSTGVACQAM